MFYLGITDMKRQRIYCKDMEKTSLFPTPLMYLGQYVRKDFGQPERFAGLLATAAFRQSPPLPLFAFFLHILFHLIFGSPITTSDLFPKTTGKFFIRMLFTLGQIIRIGLVDGTDNRRKIICRAFTPSVTLHIFPRQTSLGYHFVDVVVGLLLFLFPAVPFERIDTAGYRRDLFRLSLGIELQQLVIVFEQYGLAGRFYRRALVYKRFFYHRRVFFDKCMIEIRSFLWHNRTLNRPLNRIH